MNLLNLYLYVAVCCLWCAHARLLPKFDAEAERLLRRIRLSPARESLVPAVHRDLLRVLQQRFPDCKGELYGSLAAGLGITQSDIDTSIVLRREDPAANLTDGQLVFEAQDVILQHPYLFEVIKAVPTAKVPILSAKHLPSGFNIDISFGNYIGVRNSKLIHHLMSLDERARDLAQILKYWARVHKITGPTMLPSYGVVTMAIFYLQQKQILPPIATLQRNADKFILNNWDMGFTENKYETRNAESLCELLGGFFKYYHEFDYKKYVVSPFLGFPVEIELFRDVDTVPEELYVYRTNVGMNITRPLGLKTPVIQDSFEHNSNLANRLIYFPERRALVEKVIRHAATEYKEGCPGFLDAILYS